MPFGTAISLGLYFAVMIAIGLFAWRRSTADSAGYLLAGRNLHPAVAALSAGASDMSGWLLLGLPGALYASGLVEAWIGIGLFAGAWINWMVVAPRLRQQTEALGNALTIPQFLANRFPDRATATARGVGDHHRRIFRGLYRRRSGRRGQAVRNRICRNAEFGG